ncbi:MAG: hypothetical protein U5L07_14700 [Desulfobacterales bacterium]|nr:hypothetical protein [Desulfobacterales bacterium]
MKLLFLTNLAFFDTLIATKQHKDKEKKPIMNDHSFAAKQNQTVNTERLGILADFFSECKIGSLLNKAGIFKAKGWGT